MREIELKQLNGRQNAIVIASAIAASTTAAHFNVFERFCAWARHYEGMQADELLVTALITAVSLTRTALHKMHFGL